MTISLGQVYQDASYLNLFATEASMVGRCGKWTMTTATSADEFALMFH